MANHVYIATSLDGYIATPDGGLDWLSSIPNPEQSDFGFSDFMSHIDAIVMGRNTFEKVLSFGEWPYTSPVFVLSTTLTQVPDHLSGKAEVIQGQIPEIISELHRRGYAELYIDGGRTIQSFLERDFIDEMIISTVPVLLGRGIPLFGSLDRSIRFEVVQTERLNHFLVKTYYKRMRQ